MEDILSTFWSAFLSAIAVPVSPEAPPQPPAIGEEGAASFWASATAGTTLGAWINWVGGRFAAALGTGTARHVWELIRSAALDRGFLWLRRIATAFLPFAWVPYLGEPLTVVAGLLKIKMVHFLVLVAAGKAAYQAVLAWIAGLG